MLPAISVLSGILESLFLTYWASHIPVLNPKSPSLSAFFLPACQVIQEKVTKTYGLLPLQIYAGSDFT